MVALREDTPRPRTVIIETNQTRAELLGHYLAGHGEFEIVAMKCTAASGVQAVARCNPDVILVSFAQPDLDVTETIARLRQATEAKIIGLVPQCSEYLIHLLTNAGCHGLFHEADEGLAGLMRIIERVQQGKHAISASVAKVQLALRMAPTSFPKLLSMREQDALVCIAHALTDEEIGRQMNISVGTALSHRKRIMNKLGIHSTPKLIDFCIEKGFRNAPLPRRFAETEFTVTSAPTWIKEAGPGAGRRGQSSPRIPSKCLNGRNRRNGFRSSLTLHAAWPEYVRTPSSMAKV